MALPKDTNEKLERLNQFKNDLDKLAAYIAKNYPEHMEAGVDPVDIAIGIMELKKDKS